MAQPGLGNIHHALLEDNKNYLLIKDDKRLTALRSLRLFSTASLLRTWAGSRSTTCGSGRRLAWPLIPPSVAGGCQRAGRGHRTVYAPP